MNFSEEQLEELYSEIEEMAGLFFSPEEIAINAGFSEDWTDTFMHDIESKNIHAPFANAYFKGRITADIEIRKAIKQSALNRSNPSLQMMATFENQSRK